jgi:beta-lactam-binding protein with PASTA domain
MAKKILVYVLIGIGTVVGIALLLNVIMMFVVGGREVTVPDVRGLSLPDATAILGEQDLRIEVYGEEYNVEYPDSTVASQSPPAGRVVKQGRKILVTVSKGTEYQDVPYCIGKPVRTARIILERAGFTVGTVARVSQLRGYPDEVLSTEPLPGSRAVRGTLVGLLVNTGLPEARVILPDLTGLPFLATKMKLERLGLFVRESSMDDDFQPLRSRVVMHEPAAGFIVSRGDTVNLITASSGSGRRGL